MSAETTDKQQPHRWDQRILLDITEPLLSSPDIKQALRQTQTDSSILRRLVAEHSDDLISKSATKVLTFVEKRASDVILPPRQSQRVLAIALLILTFIGVTVWLRNSSVASVLFAVILVPFVILFVTYYIIFSVRQPMEPTDATRDILRREVMGPFLREQINYILAAQDDFEIMRITRAPGLADLSGQEYLVATDTMSSVAQLCTSMTSGSIGISGPRGVGKTTLLRYFCGPLGLTESGREGLANLSDLRIMVSAPVEYDTKDFILHLFGKLCETVLGPERSTNSIAADVRTRSAFKVTLVMVVACASFIFGVGLLGYVLQKPTHLPRVTHADLYVCVGIILIALAIGLFLRSARLARSARQSSPANQTVLEEAAAWLTRIGYLQTLTTAYAGAMAIPSGPQLSISSTRQLSELQLTLPDLIESYKAFATRCILWRRSSLTPANLIYANHEWRNQRIRLLERRAELSRGISKSLEKTIGIGHLARLTRMIEEYSTSRAGIERTIAAALPRRDENEDGPRILIGIDEIDKIDANSAQRFLNDIKAIFGVSYCVYLVSVSDEALAVFEQRVLLGRTAFDSSFDEVIRVRELNFVSCRHLLRRRIAGIPDSLIAFCTVMSGGLPRDLIRIARSVVDACASGLTRISDLTVAVVVDQVEVLKRAFIIEMSHADRKKLNSNLWEALLKDDWPGSSAYSMLESLRYIMNSGLPMSFNAALYFNATVTEIFDMETSRVQQTLVNYNPSDADCIDRLAHARNMISINCDIAWESISNFRAAYNLTTIDRPERAL